MSQTNAFAKANNPDYVYLDLQQTNVYNNSINDDVDINFIVTRDTPVIANTGDYTVSVSRFQIDTYKLPTLVVEPDLVAQPFDPTRTIHKVALINNEATLPLDPNEYTSIFPLLQTLPITPSVPSYTTKTASSFEGEYIVASAAQTTNGGIVGHGTIYIWRRGANGDYSVTPIADSVFNNTIPNIYIGISLAISEDGKWIAVGTSDVVGAHSYIIERNTSTSYKIPKPSSSFSVVALNQDGTIMVIGYPTASNSGTNRGIIQILRRTGAVTTTSVIQTINGTTNNIGLGYSVAINGDGSRIIVGSLPATNTDGTVIVYTNLEPRTTNIWTAATITIDQSVNNGDFGKAVAISHTGATIAVGNDDQDNIGAVSIYDYDIDTDTYVFTTAILPIQFQSIGFGSVFALSYDGGELIVGSPAYNGGVGRVDLYIYFEGQWTDITENNGVEANQNYGSSIATFNDGRGVVIASFGNGATPYGSLEVRTFGANFYTTIPSVIKNHITVESVMWITEYPSSIVPPRSGLTGKNSVNFLYYWCDSYARFIGQVNKALYKAYVANFNYIYANWVNGLSLTQKNIFYNIIARSYSTPPFLEWSNSALKASLVVNELFNSTEVNYAISERLWTNPEDTPDWSNDPNPVLPFNFKIAFNASLYALFNSFPATETVIENEKFFIIDFTYPVPNIVSRSLNAIPLYPNYPFLDPFIGFDDIISLSSPIEYPNTGKFIVLEQELSTIDTWCPINGIVFTTNTLPIVINQFSTNSSVNGERPNPEAGADFALVITDLQTNQQGYKPNLIYIPTAEYRRVDMTGNLGLTNIDIRVFWRAKTGQLIPMKLGSGATASIKLMFQKKLLAERQQLQFQQFSVKDLKL